MDLCIKREISKIKFPGDLRKHDPFFLIKELKSAQNLTSRKIHRLSRHPEHANRMHQGHLRIYHHFDLCPVLSHNYFQCCRERQKRNKIQKVGRSKSFLSPDNCRNIKLWAWYKINIMETNRDLISFQTHLICPCNGYLSTRISKLFPLFRNLPI